MSECGLGKQVSDTRAAAWAGMALLAEGILAEHSSTDPEGMSRVVCDLHLSIPRLGTSEVRGSLGTHISQIRNMRLREENCCFQNHEVRQ